MKHSPMTTVEQPVAPELAERRYVYNGEPSSAAFEPIRRGNRPVRKRKSSPFNIVILLFAASIMIVFYVWNKITVNRLAVELSDLQGRYERILNTSVGLRAEISKKSNMDRITKLASGTLGLVPPRTQPISFEVQFDRLRELQEK